MKNGSGIGYKNWLYDTVEYKFSTVSGVIRLSDNSIAVGIDAKDVWANASKNKRAVIRPQSIQLSITAMPIPRLS